MLFLSLLRKKCRLTWFQILARSLIAGQLLHFSEPLNSAKRGIIITATLQGCCGGLNKTSQAQGSPPRAAPRKCMGLADYSRGTMCAKVDCSRGHQRSSDHVFRAPASPPTGRHQERLPSRGSIWEGLQGQGVPQAEMTGDDAPGKGPGNKKALGIHSIIVHRSAPSTKLSWAPTMGQAL